METGINLLGEWKASEKEIIQKIFILRQGINAETVHDIRVAIKKLRAYCELSNHLEGPAKNELPQTKLLFDVLGKHREWDMVLEYLKKSPDDQGELCPSFVAHIHQAKNEILHLIKNALDEYNVNELKEVRNRLEELINVMSLQKVSGNCRIS